MEKKAGFIKIREHIVNRITLADDRPVTFPTARELGKMFHVSHPTVLRALKGLIEDGFLEPCKNGGVVSRPRKNDPRQKIFGSVAGNGRQTFEGHFFFEFADRLLGELLRRDECFLVHRIQVEEPNHIQKAVSSASLSGLFLVCPGERMLNYAEKLHRDGFPVASFGGRWSAGRSISSACINMREYMCDNLRRLFAEGRRKILLVVLENYRKEAESAVAEACGSAGLPEKCVHILCDAGLVLRDSFFTLMDSGVVFDGVVFQYTPAGTYCRLVEKMDVEQQCRVVAGSFAVCNNMQYTGYVSRFDLDDAAGLLVGNLLEQLENPDVPVISETIQYQTLFYKGGKVLCLGQET